MTLWEENKGYSCGVIALYWTEVQEGKIKHSARSYADFLIESMKTNRISNPDIKSSNGTLLFLKDNGNKSKNTDIFADTDLQKYTKFWMYAGQGGIFVSDMHWVAFYKRGSEFVMYDHNPNDLHRPPKEEFILNRENILKFWERQGFKIDEDKGKPVEKKEAWMKIYGANN